MVQGSDATTTYTDYVNRYKAVLQTMSYNFTKTETTAEICAGIVKATGVYPKNPTQHMCDRDMLETTPEIQPAFVNSLTGERKLIECIRVDGAGDERPLHEEVQFLWTSRHLDKATLVTTCSSGSSYLNRVELQNGCLSQAHSNMFIPSTLGGSCFSTVTGKVDQEKYSRNMDLATDVYISRTNHCPCGETVINMYKGADSSQKQEERKFLIQYLKGSKKQKELVKHEHPELYSNFEKVWALRQRHMVKNVPSQYIFFLVCCLELYCLHPICKSQNVTQLPTWYSGGPSISCIPLPIPDPNHPWGRADCDQCRGICSGHFLKPSEALNSTLTFMAVPPSVVLKEASRSVPSILLLKLSVRWLQNVFFSPLIKSECGSNTYIPLQKTVGGVLLVQLLREEKRSKRDKEKGRVYTVVLHVSVLTRDSLNLLKTGLVAKLATHGFILFVQVLILLLFQTGFIVMIAPNDKF